MVKKASLQLGISTIVVLVIAMVLIAGGIAFIRGFLGKGTDSLGKVFDITDFSINPDSQTPLVFGEGNQLSIKKGERKTVKIGIFNKEAEDKTFDLEVTKCTGDIKPKIDYLSKKIKSGESVGFNIFVDAVNDDDKEEDITSGEYICDLTAKIDDDAYASKDFVMTVFT